MEIIVGIALLFFGAVVAYISLSEKITPVIKKFKPGKSEKWYISRSVDVGVYGLLTAVSSGVVVLLLIGSFGSATATANVMSFFWWFIVAPHIAVIVIPIAVIVVIGAGKWLIGKLDSIADSK